MIYPDKEKDLTDGHCEQCRWCELCATGWCELCATGDSDNFKCIQIWHQQGGDKE